MTDRHPLHALVAGKDTGAFEDVIARYGPMVLRVCRDILPDPNDADDAFQATFLILVRRCGQIRDPGALGTWLYGVASRVATRARVQSRKRQGKERQVEAVAALVPSDEPARNPELGTLLHAELGRLPDSLRDPLVLCYLEGASYEEAAQRLRLPIGTLKGRLGRGRELLRSRLARRGLASAGALLIALLGRPAEAVPSELIEETSNAAALATELGRLPETIPPSVSRLVEGELRAHLLIDQPVVLAALGVAVAALVCGLWLEVAPKPAVARPLPLPPPPVVISSPAPASEVPGFLRPDVASCHE